jgi:TRAP transporter TAXI family solute receptor
MNANATATAASSANVAMLKNGEVDVIFVQNDHAFAAVNEVEPFVGKAMKDLRPIAALYDEVVQLVALADSGIKSVADLRGKKVSVGAAGSGVELNAKQVLQSAGLTYEDIKVQYLSFAESASNLKDGNIDAAFNTAGMPTAAIQDLSVSKKIVIVPIEGDMAKALIAKYPSYTPVKIPSGTYQGQTVEVSSVSVKALLAVSAKMDDDLVYQLLKTMYANGERLAASHKRAADIKLATGSAGISVPLHPGAVKFYKENK